MSRPSDVDSSSNAPSNASSIGPSTEAPQRDPRGARVLLVSFFLPPLGTLMALWMLARLKRDHTTRALRSELWIAAANGVIAVFVVWKGITLLRWLLRQFPEVYGNGW